MSSRRDVDHVRLVDATDLGDRTTATLVASLAARLGTLHFVSGAAAIGSLVAGFAALGREISRTADGKVVRHGLEMGRAAKNGEALWASLRIGEWASGLPPSPVVDHLRNDLAVLLADDLEETLALLPIPSAPGTGVAQEPDAAVTAVDCMMGLWAYGRELVRAVEALAPRARGRQEAVVASAEAPPERGGPVLR